MCPPGGKADQEDSEECEEGGFAGLECPEVAGGLVDGVDDAGGRLKTFIQYDLLSFGAPLEGTAIGIREQELQAASKQPSADSSARHRPHERLFGHSASRTLG